MPHLVLITGLPGVGKTTVATELSKVSYQRVHFGGLLRAAVERRVGRVITHEEFRRDFPTLVSAEDIEAATVLAREAVDKSTSSTCVLDSHAVTPTRGGLRVTPDDSNHMRLLKVDLVVHLGLTGCVERVVRNSRADGRHPVTEQEALLAESLQLSTCVVYASGYHCPLIVVQAGGALSETVQRVDNAIRTGLGWYAR